MEKLIYLGKKIVLVLLILLVLPAIVYGARTDSVWNKYGTYIKPNALYGLNILISGTNKYLNFGSFSGTSGYGFRDNAGTMEFKSSGGSWGVFGGVSQTPWTENIDGGGYDLTNVGNASTTQLTTSDTLFTDKITSASSNSIEFITGGDTDDFFSFKTTAGRPYFKREGGKFIYIESSNVNDVGLSLRKDDNNSGTLIFNKDTNQFGLTSKNPLIFRADEDYDDYITINTTGSYPILSVASSSGFKINAGGTNSLLLNDAGGNVGIATTSPYAKLSVSGRVVADYFSVHSDTETSTFANVVINAKNATDPVFTINGGRTYLNTDGAGGTASIDFAVGYSSTGLNEYSNGLDLWANGTLGMHIHNGGDFVSMGAGRSPLIDLAIDDADTGISVNSGEIKLMVNNAPVFRGITGLNSVFAGKNAGVLLSTGGYSNVAFGEDALSTATSSDSNVAIGRNSLKNLLYGGGNNTAIGYASGDTITTGSNNIVIGYNTDTTSATANYKLNIGNSIYGDLSNDYIGISTSSPLHNLEILGDLLTGRAGHNSVFDTDGHLTMSGDARVYKSVWLGAGVAKAPGSNPASFVECGLTGVWEFDNAIEANQEHVSGTFKIPDDMDTTEAPIFNIGWSADGVSPGDAVWQLEYLWLSPDENTCAGAQETASTTVSASATTNGFVLSPMAGVIDPPSATDKAMLWKVTRVSGDGADTIADTVELRGVAIKYISDKLGEGI